MCRGSPCISSGRLESRSISKSTPLSSTVFRKVSTIEYISFPGLNQVAFLSTFPASIFEKSKISLIIDKRPSPEDRIMEIYSRCSSVRVVSSKSSNIPIIPFIGVRIS